MEECQSVGQLRTLPTVSAKPKWEYLECIARIVEHDDRIVTCIPILADASICLVAFRDAGDDVFGAHAVELGVYYRNHQEEVICTGSAKLQRTEGMNDQEWFRLLRNACMNRCGDPNRLNRLQTFVELRNHAHDSR